MSKRRSAVAGAVSGALFSLLSVSAEAAVSVAVDSPYTFAGTTARLYLAGPTVPNVDTNFSRWRTSYSAPPRPFNFKVSNVEAAKPFIKVYAERDTGSPVFVPVFASTNTTAVGTALGVGNAAVQLAAGLTQGYVGIDPSAICNYSGPPNNLGIEGCDDSTSQVVPSEIFTLHFEGFDAAAAALPSNTDNASHAEVKFTSDAPSTTCPTNSFFPSDQAILVSPSAFSSTTTTTTSGVLIHLLVAAGTPTVNTGALLSNPIIGRPTWGQTDVKVGGFTNVDPNATPAAPIYEAAFAAVDSAGGFQFDAVSCPVKTNVFASDIQGFLKESNCFIATASYRDGRAPGVMLLRHFRDEILLNTRLGTQFVDLYYTYGPNAANWLIERPEYRIPVLSFLLPVQFIAWAVTNPAAFASLCLMLLSIAFGLQFVIRRRLHRPSLIISALALIFLVQGHPLALAQESNQPYIDSLLSTMEPTGDAPSVDNPDPYIQSQRKNLEKGESSEDYSGKLRRGMDPPSDATGYAERIKRDLAPQGSAIEDFKKGRKLKADRGDDRNRGVFALGAGVSMNRTYDANTAEDRPYSLVYGDKFVPDFRISHEFHPWMGSFSNQIGILSSLGFSFVSGNGRFAYVDPSAGFGEQSRTTFKFITVPFQIGPILRIPLGRTLTPFFGAGPGAIGFIERRNDEQEGMRGYSFTYWATGGLDIGIDFLSSKQSWEAYQSNGVKRTSLTIGYHILNSLPGGLIDMTTNGVIAGISFQL